MVRYLSTDEIIALFGDPKPFLDETGMPTKGWELSIIEVIALPSKIPVSWSNTQFALHLKVHKHIAQKLEEVLWKIHENKEAWATIDSIGGCYEWRRNRKNPKELSRHSWGVAIDLDVNDNKQGTAGAMHPFIIATFEDAGFIWGGRFKGSAIDPMHFEAGKLDGWK